MIDPMNLCQRKLAHRLSRVGVLQRDDSYKRVSRQITEGRGRRRDVRSTTSMFWTLSTPMRAPLEMADGNAPTCTRAGTARPGQPTMVGDFDAVTGTDGAQGATIRPTRCPGRTG